MNEIVEVKDQTLANPGNLTIYISEKPMMAERTIYIPYPVKEAEKPKDDSKYLVNAIAWTIAITGVTFEVVQGYKFIFHGEVLGIFKKAGHWFFDNILG